MRQMIDFECGDDLLVGTLDEGNHDTGLLIISGGNEIRSGAHSGQAQIAAYFSGLGYCVFRYDRRGIGDSEGVNSGFENSRDDIAAAVATFQIKAPQIKKIIAFGNCDAATSLALFHKNLPIDMLILANPWVIEPQGSDDKTDDIPVAPSAAAIRARYWARLKSPRSLIDLITGRINLMKLAGGLLKASQKEAPSGLAAQIGNALGESAVPAAILLAKRDTTALAFMGVWNDAIFARARVRDGVKIHSLDSASHSFADDISKQWLRDRIREALTNALI